QDACCQEFALKNKPVPPAKRFAESASLVQSDAAVSIHPGPFFVQDAVVESAQTVSNLLPRPFLPLRGYICGEMRFCSVQFCSWPWASDLRKRKTPRTRPKHPKRPRH